MSISHAAIQNISRVTYQLNILSGLPLDIVYQILRSLDYKSVVQFGLTCREFFRIHSTDSVWKYLCESDSLTCLAMRKIPKTVHASWKAYYRISVGQLAELMLLRKKEHGRILLQQKMG